GCRRPPAGRTGAPAPRRAPPAPCSAMAPPWSRTGPAVRDAAPSSDPAAARAPARRSSPRDRTARSPRTSPDRAPPGSLPPSQCVPRRRARSRAAPPSPQPGRSYELVDPFTWGDLPGRRRGRAEHRLHLPQHQVAPWRQRVPEAREELLLHGPLEVDDHVAAEDQVLVLRERIPHQVERPELDEPPRLRPQPPDPPAVEPACAQLRRRVAQREIAVLAAARDLQALLVDVRAQHLDAPQPGIPASRAAERLQ